MTAEKAVKTPRELGALVWGALALLVSAVPPRDAPYESIQEVFKAALTMEGKPGGYTDSRVPFPWLKTTAPLPERLQVVLELVENLADASVCRRLVKTLPEYAGIDPVPMNNPPTVP